MDIDELVMFVVDFYEEKYSLGNPFLFLERVKTSYLKVFELFDSLHILTIMISKIYLFIQEKDVLLKISLQLINFFEAHLGLPSTMKTKYDLYKDFYEYWFKQLLGQGKILIQFVYEFLKTELKFSGQEVGRLEKVVLSLNLQPESETDDSDIKEYILTHPVSMKT